MILSPRTLNTWIGLWLSFAFMSRLSAEPLKTNEGFAVPEPNHAFIFPRDHGNHPEFKIEWWYLTGHLVDSQKRRFGFQATFFRQANTAGNQPVKTQAPSPVFGYDQIYLAHFALTDVQGGHFYFQERLNRDGWDASSALDTLDVRNGSWSLRFTDPAKDLMVLRGSVHNDVNLSLSLNPIKPLVRFGENGVSRKGSEPTAASYYLTFPRLHAEGQLTVNDTPLSISGEAWMDHEISSSQLGADEVGWDWLSIQFSDQRELMVYRMRRTDGSADPASSCTWIERDGSTHVSPFTWNVLDTWKSPKTGGKYPTRVRLTTTDPTTGQNRQFTIEPTLEGQELSGQIEEIPYWEGDCRVIDDGTKTVIGAAYLELTGYAKALRL